MSDSMPIMTGMGTTGTGPDAATLGEGATATSGETFPALFDAQLESAGKQAAKFPAELLQMNSAELLDAGDMAAGMASVLPQSGNALPPTAMVNVPLVTATTETGLSAAAMPSASVVSGVSKELSDSLLAGKTAPELNARLAATNVDATLDANKTKMMAQTENSADMLAGKENALLMQMQGKKAAMLPEFNAAQTDPLTQPQSLSGQSAAQNLTGALAGMSMAGTTARPDVVSTTIAIPPQNPAWNSAMGDRVQWMINQNIQQAEIRLDPPELGALEVRVQVNKDQANVMFTAPNQQVRDAVEAAVPRLREMLSEIGLSLGDVGVSQESFAQSRESQDEAGNGNGHASASDSAEADAVVNEQAVVRGQGLIDAYA